MSSQENILRSLTSSSSVKFDGALQILDIITEMVSDRVGAKLCVTLYRRQNDSQYRLLAIEDTAGLVTCELPVVEQFINVFGGRQDLSDRYLDIHDFTSESPAMEEIVKRLGLERLYVHVFSPQNGDSAMIVSVMAHDERTGIVSARKVCQLAAQQFNVIFQFVELELRQLVVAAFMRVILRLSALSFEGLSVSDALERVRLLGCELTGVTNVEILTTDSSPDMYRSIIGLFKNQVETASDLGLVLQGDSKSKRAELTETEETLVETDSSVGASRFEDSSYVVGLEKGSEPQWILRFWPNEFSEFSEDESRLMKMFGSYSGVALANYSLLRKQRRANDELRGAQDRLVEAESLAALGDMATGVAHDFNNLLGGIIGRVELMANKYQDPKLVDELKSIERLATDGAERVKRLQEFAIAAKPAELEPFDIRLFIESYSSVSHSWSDSASSKRIKVSYADTQDSAIMIAAKGGDIELLLDSLVKNAIEATAVDGAVEVLLTLTEDRAIVSVRDTGCGIPTSIKNKIFNPFFSTKTDKGAGLGLSVAHGIAVRHGGAIKAESDDLSIGSTFTTSFPLIEGPFEIAEVHEEETEDRPLRIMVVDDDPQIREVLGDMLTLIDQQTDLYEDGASALAGFVKGKYDLVITDLGMPGMSGLELTEALKKEDPSLPVAMITGWGAQLNQSEMLEKGIFTVVAKPFYLKDVRELISTVPTL